MIRNDGAYQIYLIEAKYPKAFAKGMWYTANLEFFGSPKGFDASGECWQKTGEHGTFDEAEARRGLRWMRKKHPNTRFRLVCVHITQKKVTVPE